MSDELKKLSATVDRIAKVLTFISAAKAAPENARKELSGAVVGHSNWNGHGLREVNGKDLHRRAVDAVTEYLVDDLAERKRSELAALAEELDCLRGSLLEQADAVRFALCDDARLAREWRP